MHFICIRTQFRLEEIDRELGVFLLELEVGLVEGWGNLERFYGSLEIVDDVFCDHGFYFFGCVLLALLHLVLDRTYVFIHTVEFLLVAAIFHCLQSIIDPLHCHLQPGHPVLY